MSEPFTYIKFWNEMTLSFQDGFLVHENDNEFSICTPLALEWLTEINQSYLVEEMELTSFSKVFFNYQMLPYQKQYSGEAKRFFDFPLTSYDVKDFHKIFNFYEHFISNSRGKKDIIRPLSKSIESTEFFVGETLTRDIVQFLLKDYDVKDLRVLFNKRLLKYLP